VPDGVNVRRLSAGVVLLLLGWVVLVGLLIGAGEVIVHSAAVTRFDHRVTANVVANRTPALDAAMKVVTWFGSWVALVVTGVLVMVLVLRRRLPAALAVVAVVFWAGESSGVALTKHVVARERPPRALWLVTAHGWSFPSGHTAVGVVVFTTLAVVVAYLSSRRTLRVLAWALALLAVAVIAFARVELGVHWTTDVVASIVFVSLWLVAVWLVAVRLLAARLVPAAPPAVDAVAGSSVSSDRGRAGAGSPGCCP
jgi:undecaprenyl-diphosphatase